LNHSHIVKIANMAQLVNVIAPIFAGEKGIFLQTIYYPLQLFANNSKGKSLELFVDSPKYATKRVGDVPYLDASAAYDNGSLVMNVVNRHPGQAIDADIEAQDKTFSGAVEAWEVNGPDIKAENDFDSIKVRAIQRSASAQGNRLAYRLPPHSYTMVKVRLV
jgi:alpha-N-arabinofuranosidase